MCGVARWKDAAMLELIEDAFIAAIITTVLVNVVILIYLTRAVLSSKPAEPENEQE